MLLIAMLHRVSDDNPETWQRCQQWLTTIVQRYSVVSPGDELRSRVNLCLTFDDAYADFYHYVFPLLQSLKISVTLAVPTAFILDDTKTPMAKRIGIPEKQALQDGVWQQGSLCTWTELKTMADSGLVKLASHGHRHIGLADPAYDAIVEQQQSKALIAERTGYEPDAYIYPYGGFTSVQHAQAQQVYHCLMRIGGASNANWQPRNKLLYRFDAEPMWRAGKLPGWQNRINWLLKRWQNQLRGR